jgi:hypothetical protein
LKCSFCPRPSSLILRLWHCTQFSC